MNSFGIIIFMNLDLDSNNDIVNFNFSSKIAAERLEN